MDQLDFSDVELHRIIGMGWDYTHIVIYPCSNTPLPQSKLRLVKWLSYVLNTILLC